MVKGKGERRGDPGSPRKRETMRQRKRERGDRGRPREREQRERGKTHMVEMVDTKVSSTFTEMCVSSNLTRRKNGTETK